MWKMSSAPVRAGLSVVVGATAALGGRVWHRWHHGLIPALHRRNRRPSIECEEAVMSQVSADDHAQAQQQLEQAKTALHFLAESLRRLADQLENPIGVRLTEPAAVPGASAPPAFAIIHQDDLVQWPQVERAVQAYAEADEACRALSAQLTPEQQAARNVAQ
jgi:hypothetical protein